MQRALVKQNKPVHNQTLENGIASVPNKTKKNDSKLEFYKTIRGKL